MIYSPSSKEFEALQKTDIDKRLKHFKNRVGGHCYFWLLYDDDGNLFAGYDELDRECISVWPAKEYALQVINQDDQKYLKSMEIHHFLDNYIDKLHDNNISIFVFPIKDMSGAIMTAESFRNMMEEELARYEDEDEYENDSIEKRLGKNKQE